ncbi:MAG: GTPase [Flavobacteriaceae bacterium]
MLIEKHTVQKLIFIYNADSGLRNVIIDGAHKILSPSTYECKLCELTFGAFTEKNVWKKFRESSDIQMEFLHKDEFKKQYASKIEHEYTFPIVLKATENTLEVYIRAKELKAMENAEMLVEFIDRRAKD